jgi:hypothetical protein
LEALLSRQNNTVLEFENELQIYEVGVTHTHTHTHGRSPSGASDSRHKRGAAWPHECLGL